MVFADLPSSQQYEAIAETIDVVFRVLRFVRPATDPNAVPSTKAPTPGGWRETWATVAACLDRHELPPIDVLARTADWAIGELHWRERYRALTADEQRVKDAAQRLHAATTTRHH